MRKRERAGGERRAGKRKIFGVLAKKLTPNQTTNTGKR